jgi:hypothetical protein
MATMTLGDQGTYGTVLRVTPLTDGTFDLIRMANPGTTADAGVIPRCLVPRVRLGLSDSEAVNQVFQIRFVGECDASTIGRGASGKVARQ